MSATPGKDVAGSPEPWTYLAEWYELRDANDRLVMEIDVDPPYDDAARERAHANGHRIAALSAENARLRALLDEAEPYVTDKMDMTQAREYRARVAATLTPGAPDAE